MKKVIDVSIGGINFTMEDDAYFRLKDYLKRFEETIPDKDEAKEVMEDVEARVAEIFQKERKYSTQVIDQKMVGIVIDHLGEVEASAPKSDSSSYSQKQEQAQTEYKMDDDGYTKGQKRFYRDVDNKMVSGVCAGLAAYLAVDVTIIRVIWAVATIFYGTGIFAYLIIWFVTPKAQTIAQKLEMNGYATTAENIRRYTSQHR